MSKTIEVTETRLCCLPKDVETYYGESIRGTNKADLGFCKHCGQLFFQSTYIDVAGGKDWEWKKLTVERA